MPRWLAVLLHIGSVAVGSYVAYEQGTILPLVISGGAQAVIGGVQHIYNPDGTPAATPYVKKEN